MQPVFLGGWGCPLEGGMGHLNLLNGVDDEHVLQVLHGTLHPVVEGRSSLGILQVQLIDGL